MSQYARNALVWASIITCLFFITNAQNPIQDDKAKAASIAPYFVSPTKMFQPVVKPAGNMLHLKCKANGSPEPNITWYKNDQPLERPLGEVRLQRWSLLLEDLITNDTGAYKCLVCNELGCISYTYLVDVVERYHNKPIVTQPVENKTVTVGSSTTLSCTFLSDSTTVIHWRRVFPDKNDSIVEILKIHVPNNIADKLGVLQIQNVTLQDDGWYVCIAGNDFGVTGARAYLKVVESGTEEEPKNATSSITTTTGSETETNLKGNTNFQNE